MLDFNRNHFELLGLQPAFRLSREQIDRAWRDIQTEIHPDRFAHAGEAAQRLAQQWSARLNEAYVTLRSPFERARYLLRLQGIDALDPRDTAMPAEFLVQQMHWRERLEQAQAASDPVALQRLEDEARAERAHLEQALAGLLDERRDYRAAAEVLRKYRFLDKLLEEIELVHERLT
ncbi:MAG: Fe-S protein assembly co-chaperone HscB [Thiobacillaceae bacterium]|nr:Fe-S protein assembly co-chaperone HscB [Thiobacillaceae bacterium]MCX7672281.1 Fe-S protein assembly co-chaperone HscB [Thiobacillaceae bacterium]MDW8322690.1 Fe-S protein assembly co-chaperone HscB [Burkholderiales bacterium]